MRVAVWINIMPKYSPQNCETPRSSIDKNLKKILITQNIIIYDRNSGINTMCECLMIRLTWSFHLVYIQNTYNQQKTICLKHCLAVQNEALWKVIKTTGIINYNYDTAQKEPALSRYSSPPMHRLVPMPWKYKPGAVVQSEQSCVFWCAAQLCDTCGKLQKKKLLRTAYLHIFTF